MREREIVMLLKLNERAKMKIETPYGQTKGIESTRIVKQGTVYRPRTCCVSTDQINRI